MHVQHMYMLNMYTCQTYNDIYMFNLCKFSADIHVVPHTHMLNSKIKLILITFDFKIHITELYKFKIYKVDEKIFLVYLETFPLDRINFMCKLLMSLPVPRKVFLSFQLVLQE